MVRQPFFVSGTSLPDSSLVGQPNSGFTTECGVGHACDKMGRERERLVQRMVLHPPRKENVIVSIHENAEAADDTFGEKLGSIPSPERTKGSRPMVLEPPSIEGIDLAIWGVGKTVVEGINGQSKEQQSMP